MLDNSTFMSDLSCEFGARKGRWMSPDPYNGSMDPSNPQSFNRYSYVRNRPLNFTDPSGAVPCPAVPVPGVDIFFATCVSAVGGTAVCGPVCGAIAGGAALVGSVLADLFTGGFFAKPAFHGSLKPRPNAPSKGNAFTCGAAAAQKVSIGGGLNALGIGAQGGVGGFLTNALGGNVFSGATGLFTGGGSMTDVAFGGTRLGVPGGATNLENGISGVVQNGVARGAFAAISAGGEITTLTGTASTVGLTAGEYASGVGEVKFAYDFLTYAGSTALCGAGIIH